MARATAQATEKPTGETPVVSPPVATLGAHFHSLDGFATVERLGANTKGFDGTDTPFLHVPGLKSLESVRIGTQEIPLTEEREYPVDNSHKRFEFETHTLVALQYAPDGRAILLRSMLSNHGIWQKSARIYVTGVWGEETPVVTETEPEGEAS